MKKRPSYPSDLADKTLLRFPDGLKQRLEEEAAANNRSLNAEIISRLQASFNPTTVTPLDDDEPGYIYVALDANGFPMSWDEIHEHVDAIRRAGKFNTYSMNVVVLDTDMLSSADRQEQAKRLSGFYRRARHKVIHPR